MKNVNVNQENVSKKLAVQFEYNPSIRVCVPLITGDEDIFDVEKNARKLVLEKLRTWTKEEIIDWVVENEEDYYESYEPYDKEYDD